MHVITNIHGERLGTSPARTFRACLDKDGNVIDDYYVSEDGSVLSAKRRKAHILRPALHTPSDHRFVAFMVNGVRTVGFVHQLVARAWIEPPPSPVHRIFHVDGNKDNNAAANLRWALGVSDRPLIPDEKIKTILQLRSEAMTLAQIADKVGRSTEVVTSVVCGRGSFKGLGIEEERARGVRSTKLTAADVDEIRQLWETRQFTQKEIAAVFGIDNSAVSYIVRGKRWKKTA
jgi:hypothetical protein